MPQRISTLELDAIAAIVSLHPAGIGVGSVRRGLAIKLPPRTLQRRFRQLEQEGRIRSAGTGKGKHYFPYSPQWERTALVQEEEVAPVPPRDTIPLSAAAREIRDIVTLPLMHRHPVGYDRSFLDSYVPNQSAYLPMETRAELARLGQVGATNWPAGTYVRQVLDRLLIDLSWNSSRLEGNTYSLLETVNLLERGESAMGKKVEETQMILNHKAAIEMLAEQAAEIGFNRYTLCNLHALLSDNLLSDPTACGRLRTRPVGISGTVFHPLEVPQRIEEQFDLMAAKAEEITDPFEQGVFVMVHLPYLQPFEDVNKRVSRLAANIPLVKKNLCPLSFVDVPQHDYVNGLIGVYELNRIDYLRDVFVWAYRRSAARYAAVLQSLGDPDPFRLHYRSQIGELSRGVVLAKMDKGRAARWIAEQVNTMANEMDRRRLIEVVETELCCLHEGNIARYRLRPSEFRDWQQQWK